MENKTALGNKSKTGNNQLEHYVSTRSHFMFTMALSRMHGVDEILSTSHQQWNFFATDLQNWMGNCASVDEKTGNPIVYRKVKKLGYEIL